jgi:hypothetical protein
MDDAKCPISNTDTLFFFLNLAIHNHKLDSKDKKGIVAPVLK